MKFVAAIFLAASQLLAAACGVGAAEPAPKVSVTLTDNAVAVSQPGAATGTVTFSVANSGSVVHSLILLKTDVPYDKLPADPQDASKVQQTGLLRETGQIAVRTSKEFSVKLAPGNYVLLCNEPGHYLVGMRTAFTVK